MIEIVVEDSLCRYCLIALVGVVSKSKVNRYKQVIEVKNTHQHDIKIQVEDQLPRSGDQKIKVGYFSHFLQIAKFSASQLFNNYLQVKLFYAVLFNIML